MDTKEYLHTVVLIESNVSDGFKNVYIEKSGSTLNGQVIYKGKEMVNHLTGERYEKRSPVHSRIGQSLLSYIVPTELSFYHEAIG